MNDLRQLMNLWYPISTTISWLVWYFGMYSKHYFCFNIRLIMDAIDVIQISQK